VIAIILSIDVEQRPLERRRDYRRPQRAAHRVATISWYNNPCTERTVLLKYLKTYLDTHLKIILLNHQNNYVERLSVDDDAAKSFNILATSLSVVHNYFDGPNNIIFRSVSS